MSSVFRVGIVPIQQYLINRHYLKHAPRMEKDTELNLMETMQERLNFNYFVKIAPDFEWGRELPDGTWTGMIKQVKREEVDFAVSYITISYKRYQAVNFTKPYFTTRVTFITKAPTLHPPDLHTLIEPFSLEVWMAIFISVILCGLVLYFVNKFRESSKNSTLLSFIWYLFGLTIYQSGNISKFRTIRSRLVLATWLLAILVLSPSYSGILTSLFALPVPSYLAENIEELNVGARTGKINVGTAEGTVYYDTIMGTSIEQWKYIRESMGKKENMVVDHEAGMKRVLEDQNYAFVCAEEIGLYLARQVGVRKYFVSQDSFYENYNAIAMKKGFRFGKEFDYIITRLQEGGFFTQWYKNLQDVGDYRSHQRFSEENEMKLQDNGFGVMLGPFVILFFGYILSAAILIMEIILHHLLKRFEVMRKM